LKDSYVSLRDKVVAVVDFIDAIDEFDPTPSGHAERLDDPIMLCFGSPFQIIFHVVLCFMGSRTS
jgi:hypothetical protein